MNKEKHIGKKEEYSFDFNKELKLAIKIRDKFRCKICKKEEKDISKGLCIHHIDYNKTNSSLENLVTLCPSCQSKTNNKRAFWIEYFSRDFNVKKTYYTIKQIEEYCLEIAKFLRKKKITGIVPIFRGGIFPAVLLSHILNVPLKDVTDNNNDVFVDEIVDHGVTFRRYHKKYPKNMFVCIHINKNHFKSDIKPDFFCEYVDTYIIYPWESNSKPF